MIALVFARHDEALPFLEAYKNGQFMDVVEGESAHDDEVVVAITGSGKIKATLRTERLLQRFTVDHLLHVGTCTALHGDAELGTLVAANQVLEGDRIELASPSYPRMPVATPFDDLPQGTFVTQDHTLSKQDELSYWQRIADFSDMTGYAVTYVAATHGTPCYIVKAVAGYHNEEDEAIQQTKATAHQAVASFLLRQVADLIDDEA